MHPNPSFRWEDRDAMRAFVREIAFALAQLDQDGSQITGGTTSIASTTGRRNVGEQDLGRGPQPASGLQPG